MNQKINVTKIFRVVHMRCVRVQWLHQATAVRFPETHSQIMPVQFFLFVLLVCGAMLIQLIYGQKNDRFETGIFLYGISCGHESPILWILSFHKSSKESLMPQSQRHHSENVFQNANVCRIKRPSNLNVFER